jgi:hypothetical protein
MLTHPLYFNFSDAVLHHHVPLFNAHVNIYSDTTDETRITKGYNTHPST